MSLKTPSPIKLVLLDVDGVMTDGSIYISEQGEYFKSFDVKDGLAIELLRAHGINTGIISGKKSPALKMRCEQLGFDFIIMGCKHKLPKLTELCEQLGISPENVAFCGDDVLDLDIMERCGVSAAPADAHDLVLNSANWVSSQPGGKSMVRHFVDHLLMGQTGLSLGDIYIPLLEKIRQNDLKGVEQ